MDDKFEKFFAEMQLQSLQKSKFAENYNSSLPGTSKTKLQDARFKLIVVPTMYTVEQFPSIDNVAYVYAANLKEANSIITINESAGFYVNKEYIN